MKVRVLSDLHLDVNSSYMFKLQNNDVFTVLCGDTSGDPALSIKWIKKNVKSGLCVCGNHIVYNRKHKPIQVLRDQMHKAFPLESDVTYLDNNCGVISKIVNGVLFVGSCLYTDYKLPVDAEYVNRVYKGDFQHYNMQIGSRGLNDFRYGIISSKRVKVKDPEEYVKRMDPYGFRRMQVEDVPKYETIRKYIAPEDYLKWNNETFENIRDVIEQNESSEKPLPVFVISHHCPSPRCVSKSYSNSKLNASYVSDYDEFIKSHNSIRCWCCGHVHHQDIFDIPHENGTTCKVIMNPRGYVPHSEDIYFNPNTFIDTDTWEVEQVKESASVTAKKKKRLDNYLRLASCFV